MFSKVSPFWTFRTPTALNSVQSLEPPLSSQTPAYVLREALNLAEHPYASVQPVTRDCLCEILGALQSLQSPVLSATLAFKFQAPQGPCILTSFSVAMLLWVLVFYAVVWKMPSNRELE